MPAAALVLSLLGAAGAPAPVDEAWLVTSEGLRARAAGPDLAVDATDEDARLAVDVGARALGGRLLFDGSGELFWDLDGARPSDAALFHSVHEAGGPTELLVHTLELGWGGDALVERASVGRLTVDEGWPVTLDGVALTLRPLAALDDAVLHGVRRSRFFVSGGRTAHLYEAGGGALGAGPDPDLFEDWAVSAGVDLVTADSARLQLDTRALVEDSTSQAFDSSTGIALFLRALALGEAKLWARTLDDDVMGLGVRARTAPDPGDRPASVGADVEVAMQPSTLREVAVDADPYVVVLGESLPHWRARADLVGRVNTGLLGAAMHVGASARANLVDEDTPFNRSAARAWILAEVTDLFVEGVFVSAELAADAALAPGASPLGLEAPDAGRVAVGGSVGLDRDGRRAELGTGWDRWKYSYYREVQEIADVRTVFAAVSVRPLDHLRVRGSAQVEVFDRTVTTLQLTLTQDLAFPGDPGAGGSP